MYYISQSEQNAENDQEWKAVHQLFFPQFSIKFERRKNEKENMMGETGIKKCTCSE